MDDYIIPEEPLRAQAKQDNITHISTGVAVLRDGKILVVRREPNDFLGGDYELPGGGVDPGETFREAVQRELFEETGLRVTAITGMFGGFDYSTDKKPRVRQFNFIVEVEKGDIHLSSEHDAYVWASKDSLDNLTMSDDMRHCISLALST